MSFLLFFNLASAQNELPNVMVKEMKGKTKHLSEFVAKEGLTIFVFWKSCCPISLGGTLFVKRGTGVVRRVKPPVNLCACIDG